MVALRAGRLRREGTTTAAASGRSTRRPECPRRQPEEEEDGGFGGGRGGGGRELRRRRPCGSGGPRAEATPARAGLAERVGALLGGKGVMVAVVGNGGERWRGLSLLVFGGEFCCSGFEGKGWQLAKLLG